MGVHYFVCHADKYRRSKVDQPSVQAVCQAMRLQQTVARNVRRLRLERGHTQEELSELAGINRNYTGIIERGERSPTVDMLEKLAKAPKIDPFALLTAGDGKDQPTS